MKLAQINERTIHRNHQIDSELIEIKQTLDSEICLQKSAKTRLMENLAQIEELKKLTQHAQLAWEATNRLLANQRQNITTVPLTSKYCGPIQA